MKKPLPPALPLCFGLPLLALWLSISLQHPDLSRPPAPSGLPTLLTATNPPDTSLIPTHQADTTPSITLQTLSSQVTLSLYPALLQGNYTNINLDWQTLVNGLPGQGGVLLHRNLSATSPTSIVLPLRIPTTSDEIILRVAGRRAAAPGHKPNQSFFTTRLPLRHWRGDYSIPSAGDLSFTDSNNIFIITSAKAQAQFDKQTGWLLHYEAGGAVLMGDTAGLRSDLGPADTLLPHLQLFFASTGTQIVIVKAEYTVPGINCLLHLSYTFNAAGDMLVEQVLETDTTATATAETTLPQSAPPLRPTIPHFGMSWILPQNLDSATWLGADQQTISAITAPVSLSREETLPGVRWFTLLSRDGKGMRISADSSLLQVNVRAADSIPGQLHPGALTLGIYKTISPATQRRFNYSYKVMPLTPTTSPSSHQPARAALPNTHHASTSPAHAAKPI
jgi:hypothetical protein